MKNKLEVAHLNIISLDTHENTTSSLEDDSELDLNNEDNLNPSPSPFPDSKRVVSSPRSLFSQANPQYTSPFSSFSCTTSPSLKSPRLRRIKSDCSNLTPRAVKRTQGSLDGKRESDAMTKYLEEDADAYVTCGNQGQASPDALVKKQTAKNSRC